MPAKITNPLKEGLPSKVYFCAFPKPVSRYAIARTIYKIPKGQIPPTAKVSNVVKDMMHETYVKQYLIEKSEGVLSNIEPLVAEIEKDLATENRKLTETEKSELNAFLDNQFRDWVAKIDLPEGDVNAYYILKNAIVLIIYKKSIFLHTRNPKSKELFQVLLPEMDMTEIDKMEIIPLSLSLIEKLEALIPEEARKFKELLGMLGERLPKLIEKLQEHST